MCRVFIIDFESEIDWLQMSDGTIYVDNAHYDELMQFITNIS